MRSGTRALLVVAVSFLVAGRAALAAAPAKPVIEEPAAGARPNAFDVHLEASPFADADPGDVHASSDWELWDVATRTRVWSDLASPFLLHDHLGDGAFEGLLAGADRLEFETRYALRVRYRDGGGAASPWSAPRRFTTAAATRVAPFETEDVLAAPAPRLLYDDGRPFFLPADPGPPRVAIDSVAGDPLFVIEARDGSSHALVDFPPLAAHAAIKVTIVSSSGGNGMTLPPFRLEFSAEHVAPFAAWFPPMALADGESSVFWIASTGASYFGSPGDVAPDFSRLARGLPVPWTVPPGFRVEEAATGFSLPVHLAFVPAPGPTPSDPLYYVTELYGRIRVVDRSGNVGTFASGLLNFVPNGVFPGSGEEGLIGLAVDPDDPSVLYATTVYRDPSDPGPHPLRNKVVRLRSADGGRTANVVEDLLEMPDDPTEFSHQVQSVTVGPDGKLYVTVGDGLIDFRTARSDGSFQGKVLRMEKSGAACLDNPFFDPGRPDEPISYVFVKGMRNPFGAAWRAADGALYVNENGEFIDRLTKVVAGRDYLWDGVAASLRNYAIHNWQPAVGPTGVAFADNGAFPPERAGRLYAAASNGTYAAGRSANGKRIFEFVLDAAGEKLAEPETFVEYVGAGRATVAGVAFGPDGLYFSGLYADGGAFPAEPGASLFRVVYTGLAAFDAAPRAGVVPLEVAFTDVSTVPDPVAWAWEFGDGTTSAERDPVHTYASAGSFGVTLTVTGRGGAVQAFAGDFVVVTPPPAPSVESISPAVGSDRFPTRVALRGSLLDVAGGLRVTVGGAPVTEIDSIGPNFLRATVPPLSLGPADVRVENDAGGETLAGAFLVRPAGLACRGGNVNAGSGAPPANVLLANGGAGDAEHVVRVRVGDPVFVSVAPPPSRLGRSSPYVVYSWDGPPDDAGVVAWPFLLGLAARPTPLSGGSPQPIDVWNTIGKTARIGAPTRASSPAPATILILPSGFPTPRTLTVQGLIRDDSSLVPERKYSATNGVVIEIIP